MNQMSINQPEDLSIQGFKVLIAGTILRTADGLQPSQQPESIKIDNYSTLTPITEAINELFNTEKAVDVEVSPSFSGIERGFKKF